jgi:PAS domain S-box-containing protein
LLGLEEHPVRKAALEGRPVRDQLVAVKAPGNPNLKWLLVSAEPILDSQSHIYRLICTYHDITERKLVEQALKESDKQFRALADSIPNLAWWANGDGYITWYNQRWYEYTGTTPAQMEGWGWQTVHDPVELPKVLECWRASIATGEPFEMTFPLRGADGVFRSFLTRIIPLKDSAGRVQQWFGTNTDVSELKQAEQALKKLNEELESRVLERTQDLAVIIEKLQFEMADREKAEKNVQRLNRLHKVLSATNHAIVRTKDRESLFSEFCRIAVEIGSFKLAWVGLVNDASSELKVVASCGATAYLEDIRITVNEEEPTGLGPTGISIREGSYYICNDFLTAEITRPWHEKGRAHGIRASASIALKQEGRVIGTLTLYADQKDFFDQQHVKLLQQMAADISFALDMIVRETYRQEAEQALNEETAERRRVEEEIRALNVNLEQRVAERTTELRHEITERERAEKQLKASLAEKEVMLREIHHRVKNNLQVISSLVSLQVDNLIDDRVREELNDVRDRVRSMAMIHEKLYLTNDLAQLNFADYATSLLRSLWRSHSTLANKVRLNLAVVPVALSIEAAVPCGLILNELAGNALKHAFPNDSGGEVTVGLEHDTTTSAICLWVRDNGVGLPSGLDWRRSPSLGLRLVQILTGQLRGTVETGTGPGAEFQVTFPLNAQS